MKMGYGNQLQSWKLTLLKKEVKVTLKQVLTKGGYTKMSGN